MEYNIRWTNQVGITESGMTKWIVTLRDTNGTLVKKIENFEDANLQNFSEVNIKMSLTYEEATKQTTSNTMKVFFDLESDDTQLTQMTVLFDITRLPLSIDDIEKADFKVPIGVGDVFTCRSNSPFGTGKDYKYILSSDGEYKLSGSTEDTFLSLNDCSTITYTGVHKTDVSSNGRCGLEHGNKRCPGGSCCSSGLCGMGINDSCNKRYNIDDTYYTYVGDDSAYDGTDVNNINIFKDGDDISTDGRCGPDHGNKRCPGKQCCSGHGWCGGRKPFYSEYCGTVSQSFYVGRGRYFYYFKGLMGLYDGSNPEPITSQNAVFKCATNDPLNNNNGTIYKWESDTLRRIDSVPSGYSVFTLPNCDGVTYGGVV